ncbi:hypothetical protein [Tenacibaculum ovolyticum]|uniref:hypothetical protein n=1 Tax=Tenacibaculum ovolyticum TaxID=104270 RepID=UPI00041176D1|nr:hypothetical protein [Tenacibaculum ovolyticum]
MIKFFSKFFNSSSNTKLIKTELPERDSADVENRLGDWLAHPNEYGKKPVYTKVLEKGSFRFIVIPDSSIMKYSLVEYKMTKDGKSEIGIVDELNVWSFLNIIDYEKVDIDELTYAYKGKLFEIMDSKMQMSNGKTKPYRFSIKNEEKKITDYFNKINPGGEFRISDIIKFFDEITFFGFNITNPENGKNILIPSYFNYESNKHIDSGLMYEEDHILFPIAMYVKIGAIFTKPVDL